MGRLRAQRKSEDFLAFLDEVASAYRNGVVHVVRDDLNTRKSPKIGDWKCRHGGRCEGTA